MKNLFNAWLLMILFDAYSCHSNSRKAVSVSKIELNQKLKTVSDGNKNDSLAMAQIEMLSEYKHLLKWYDKTNKDTSRHIAVLVDERPTHRFNYYQITVGEDMPDHFLAMMHFYVDAKNQSVKFLDVETDSLMTLSQWRNSGKDEWK
jgi:hypothetical protein